MPECEAGRGLDARIAERVLGWHYDGDDRWYPTPDTLLRGLPPFSTDWGAAGQVLDRLADMGYVIFIKADGLRNGTFSPRYTAICGNQPRTDAVTGPLAICIAALKALGET